MLAKQQASPPKSLEASPRKTSSPSHSSDTTEHLSNVIAALGKKITAMESEAIELENTRKLLEESENARTDLRCSLSESAEKVKKESEKAKKAQLMLIEENKELTINNLALSNKAYEIEQENAALKDQKMAAEICLLKEEQKDSAGMQKVLEEVQKQKDLLEASYKTGLDKYEKEVVEHNMDTEKLLNENRALLEKVNQLQGTIISLQSDLKAVTAEKDKLRVLNKKMTESIDILKGTVKECDMYKTLTKEKSEIITRLQNELYVINSELDSYKEASKKQFNELLAKHDLKAKELQEKLAQKRELDISYKSLKTDYMELQSKMISYEQLICATEDTNTKLDSSEHTIALLRNEKEKLEAELRGAGAQLERLTEKVYTSEQKLQMNSAMLRGKEEQIDLLKTFIHELTMKIQSYAPCKGDKIDEKLAEYLNNLPDSLGIRTLFIRESEGIYRFGSKRIFIKLELDKLMVRVGGGYLSLDEFIELHGQAEIEKINKRN